MYLAELLIENYRIFGRQEDGKGLSLSLNRGLNVVVGENDCGKTAIIDAIRHLLWTTSMDYNPITDDDFHVEGQDRAKSLTIRACFRDLTPRIIGRFLEWVSIDGDIPCLYVTLGATRLENKPNTARRRNISVTARAGKKGVLRYLVWVITINFWGLCPQTPGVYRLNTNPEEVKRGQQ